MKYLRGYIREHARLIAAAVLLTVAGALLYFLFDLPLSPLMYILLVCGVLGLCVFVIPDYVSYLRRVKDIELLRANILTTDISDLPSDGLPLREKELAETLKTLREHIRELETGENIRREDMISYYTLWAHQIKTPLSAMRLILQSDPTENAEALKQELFKVERYVEMVLGYLRLETMSSDLRLERCSVRDIVNQAAKKFAPQFIYKRLTLDVADFDNAVVTDEKWLLFVTEQLMSNAVKYTESGGVTVTMDENDVLTIRDTGAGISPEDLPRIFERGFTGMNGRADKSATGLGLYLVKQVLDKLRNRIEIESVPNQGTEVRLYLHRNEINNY